LTGTKRGYLRLAIICEVEELGSPTSMVVARAEVDAPRVAVIPPMIDLGIQYLYCEIERLITLRNLRALPACFSWWSQDGVGDHKHVIIQWSQVSGKIPPCQEIHLTFKFTPQRLVLSLSLIFANQCSYSIKVCILVTNFQYKKGHWRDGKSKNMFG
jgi:hypothetical protein